jgi:ferric-chelate reductase
MWGLDRLLRVIRLVLFNNSYFGVKSGSGTLDGSTELVSPDFVRLTLRRPPRFHWKAGQSVFLTMPSVSGHPFEAHPFTIASIECSNPGRKMDIIPGTDSEKNGSWATSSISFDSPGPECGASWNELVFLISVRGGLTKRLANTASKKGTVKVFVDGPYGPSADLDCFDTSVLIAGGWLDVYNRGDV